MITKGVAVSPTALYRWTEGETETYTVVLTAEASEESVTVKVSLGRRTTFV